MNPGVVPLPVKQEEMMLSTVICSQDEWISDTAILTSLFPDSDWEPPQPATDPLAIPLVKEEEPVVPTPPPDEAEWLDEVSHHRWEATGRGREGNFDPGGQEPAFCPRLPEIKQEACIVSQESCALPILEESSEQEAEALRLRWQNLGSWTVTFGTEEERQAWKVLQDTSYPSDNGDNLGEATDQKEKNFCEDEGNISVTKIANEDGTFTMDIDIIEHKPDLEPYSEATGNQVCLSSFSSSSSSSTVPSAVGSGHLANEINTVSTASSQAHTEPSRDLNAPDFNNSSKQSGLWEHEDDRSSQMCFNENKNEFPINTSSADSLPCGKCNNTFSSCLELLLHPCITKKIANAIANANTQRSQQHTPNQGQVSCSACLKSFASPNMLNAHKCLRPRKDRHHIGDSDIMEEEGNNENDSDYVCSEGDDDDDDYCEKSISAQRARVRLSEKAKRRQVVAKSPIGQSDLREKSQSEELFQCSICGKLFKYSRYYIRHMAWHASCSQVVDAGSCAQGRPAGNSVLEASCNKTGTDVTDDHSVGVLRRDFAAEPMPRRGEGNTVGNINVESLGCDVGRPPVNSHTMAEPFTLHSSYVKEELENLDNGMDCCYGATGPLSNDDDFVVQVPFDRGEQSAIRQRAAEESAEQVNQPAFPYSDALKDLVQERQVPSDRCSILMGLLSTNVCQTEYNNCRRDIIDDVLVREESLIEHSADCSTSSQVRHGHQLPSYLVPSDMQVSACADESVCEVNFFEESGVGSEEGMNETFFLAPDTKPTICMTQENTDSFCTFPLAASDSTTLGRQSNEFTSSNCSANIPLQGLQQSESQEGSRINVNVHSVSTSSATPVQNSIAAQDVLGRGESFRCEKCKSIFPSCLSLLLHRCAALERERDETCSACLKSFPSSNLLNAHKCLRRRKNRTSVRDYDMTEVVGNSDNENDSDYVCSEEGDDDIAVRRCRVGFSNKSKGQQVSKKQRVMLSNALEKKNIRGTLRCSICGKGFKSSSVLLCHMAWHAGHAQAPSPTLCGENTSAETTEVDIITLG